MAQPCNRALSVRMPADSFYTSLLCQGNAAAMQMSRVRVRCMKPICMSCVKNVNTDCGVMSADAGLVIRLFICFCKNVFSWSLVKPRIKMLLISHTVATFVIQHIVWQDTALLWKSCVWIHVNGYSQIFNNNNQKNILLITNFLNTFIVYNIVWQDIA